jgi:type II secretory pathway predicted ATPase ExeA
MTHLGHWKIAKSPFAYSGTREWFFEGESIEEALARIGFLISNRRRFGILVGPTGGGRTALLRNVESSIARHEKQVLSKVFVVSAARCSSLAARLVSVGGFGNQDSVRVQDREYARWRLEDLFVAMRASSEQGTLLLDDLHLANETVRQEVSWLLRIDAPLTIIGAVTDAALQTIKPDHLDRCELRIDLLPWELSQTAEYFEAALEHAGASDDCFDSQSIIRIQELSGGIPRRISQLAELCLVAGAVQRREQITVDVVEEVCHELPGISIDDRSTGRMSA